MPILIIDDDSVIRTMLVRMARHLGYVPLEASNLSDGLRIVQRTHIECILLDVTLIGIRGSAGFQILQQLTVPIILMSGLDEESASRHLGNTDRIGYAFLAKPFGFAEIQQTLQHAVAHR